MGEARAARKEAKAEQRAERNLAAWRAERDGNMRGAAHWIDIIIALVSIGAGLYLLSGQTTTGDSSWFSLIAHGMGAYFVAKGFFMGRSLHLQSRTVELLASLDERQESR